MSTVFDVDVRTSAEKSAEAHRLMEGLVDDGITATKLYALVESSLVEEQAGLNRPLTITELHHYLDALDLLTSPLVSGS